MTYSVQLSWDYLLLMTCLTCLFCLAVRSNGAAQESPPPGSSINAQMQTWNWHVQNTDIVQGYPPFAAKYYGPNSLLSVRSSARNRFAGFDGRCTAVAGC